MDGTQLVDDPSLSPLRNLCTEGSGQPLTRIPKDGDARAPRDATPAALFSDATMNPANKQEG